MVRAADVACMSFDVKLVQYCVRWILLGCMPPAVTTDLHTWQYANEYNM